MKRRIVSTTIAGAVALMLAGCSGPATTDSPAPTVTVTASPEPEASIPAVGDELTSLGVWDICFAHTFTQTQSDVTEWSPYSEGLVERPSGGLFIVTIENVRTGGLNDAGFMYDDFGTVTCRVEGRVGGAIIAEWTRSAS